MPPQHAIFQMVMNEIHVSDQLPKWTEEQDIFYMFLRQFIRFYHWEKGP